MKTAQGSVCPFGHALAGLDRGDYSCRYYFTFSEVNQVVVAKCLSSYDLSLQNVPTIFWRKVQR